MSVPSTKMWMAVSEPVVFLRITGRADCTASTDLDNLGVLHLFKLIHEPTPLPANMEPLPPSPHPISKKEMSRNSLEAHRTLMDLNPANIPKFKEVAKFLAEDLKRLEAEAG